jgi:Ca2+-binding EF-hand superfamily protein
MEIKRLFETLDRNRNGKLELNEVKLLFAKAETNITDKELEDLVI